MGGEEDTPINIAYLLSHQIALISYVFILKLSCLNLPSFKVMLYVHLLDRNITETFWYDTDTEY